MAPEFVTSRDGTRIGFLRQGSGPGIVLVQGAMADVHAYRELADALAPSHMVIRAERRGRGLSPRRFDDGHRIARDVEDLAAVMDATGARTLFGLSSGAVIVLEAARTVELVDRAVVYVPPFSEHGIDRVAMARLFAELDRGDLPSAPPRRSSVRSHVRRPVRLQLRATRVPRPRTRRPLE